MKRDISLEGKNLQTSENKDLSYKDFTLNGVESLEVTKVFTVHEYTHELHPRTGNPYKLISSKVKEHTSERLHFDLREITVKELSRIRKTRIPSFVLKTDGKYYYAEILTELKLCSVKLFGQHMCSCNCNHVTAASDEEGGCAKVRNDSQYIELYPWITKGFETFNTSADAMFVAECAHYAKCVSNKKKLSRDQLNAAKYELALYVWEDVKDLAQARERAFRSSYHPYY